MSEHEVLRLSQIIAVLEQRISVLEQAVIRISVSAPVTPQSLPLAPTASPHLRRDMPEPGYTSLTAPTPATVNPRPAPDPDWIPIPHTRGEYPCGKTAQYVTHRVSRTDPAKLSMLRIYDEAFPEKKWHMPDPKSYGMCSSCRRVIDPHGSEDLDWSGAYDDASASAPAATPTPAVPMMEQASVLPQAPRSLQEQTDSLRAAMELARTFAPNLFSLPHTPDEGDLR